MKVSELIEELNKYDKDQEIIVGHDLNQWREGAEAFTIIKVNDDFDDSVLLIEINI